MARKVYVVLPAYNEAPALSRLLPRIAAALIAALRHFEILVVNDGSTDDTSNLLRSLPPGHMTRELLHPVNQGYGASLKTGILRALETAEANDTIVTLDADNTQDPEYMPRLLEALDGGFDGVTASYTMPGGHSTGVPMIRRWMSRTLNGWLHMVCPIPGIETYTNGYRAYRVSAVQRAHQKYGRGLIEAPGFPGGTECFLKIAGQGEKFTEIPFDLHYEQRGNGSKIHLFSTILGYLKLVAKSRTYVHP